MLYVNQEDVKKKVVFCKDRREVSLDNLVSAPGVKAFCHAGPSFNHLERVWCICIRDGSKYPLVLFFFFCWRNAINHRVISHPIEQPVVRVGPIAVLMARLPGSRNKRVASEETHLLGSCAK